MLKIQHLVRKRQKTSSNCSKLPQTIVSTSKEEYPIANKLMEKNGANPKVAEDTAAYKIPFIRFMSFSSKADTKIDNNT